MTNKTIIYVPGKSPKPPAKQHIDLLWRTLVEGAYRADPDIAAEIKLNKERFQIIDWNYAYYQHSHDVTLDLPWVDALINQHGPSKEDIQTARSWRIKLHRITYLIADVFPWLIQWLPESARSTIDETDAYFKNHNNIGYEIRGMLKSVLRPLLDKNQPVLIIGHSLGSVIAYDTLWELSRTEIHSGKVDLLTLGSPLGLKFVQNKLQGRQYPNQNKYPANIEHWINVTSEGDTTAVDRNLKDDFKEMVKYKLLTSLEDHCKGIYNFYHNEEGLNCHTSYGYLVNPAVGSIITDWWKKSA